MRVVVTGASGNVGTSVLRAFALDGQIAEVAGIARRRPELAFPKTRWVVADIARDDLVPILRNRRKEPVGRAVAARPTRRV